jgi:membrane-bound lytic murein transglycosylase D
MLMQQRLLVLLIISIATVIFSSSCASLKGDGASGAAAVEVVEVSEQGESASGETAAQDETDPVTLAENRVLEEASALRKEGLRLGREGNLEDARDALDDALNTILGSGMALDAHPRLFALFRAISNEAIAIDEELAEADNAVLESTLADELDTVKSEESVGENEEAPPAVTYDLPVVLNNRVRQFIERFQGERRGVFAEGLVRSGRYLDLFKKILKEEGVPTDLAYMPQVESTYKVKAYSRAKAKGIWQFMSWTGKRYGLEINWWIDERSDPERSCRAAARYLKDLYAELGDWLLAMAAYNGGPGRVGKAVRAMRTTDFWTISSTSKYLRRETRNFVPAILAAIIIMKQPSEYGFDDVKPDSPLEYETVRIDSATDLRIAAELAGVSLEKLQEFNPALRQLVTPADYPDFELKLPKGTKAAFEAKYAALPQNKRLKYDEHVVRRGETLSLIAKRYGASVAAIQMANNIRNPHKLQPGQHLLVPLSMVAEPSKSTVGVAAAKYPRGTRITHQVRRGESLYIIALAYGTTVESLIQWNNLDPKAPIYPGDKLAVTTGTTVKQNVRTQPNSKKIVHNVRQGDTLYGIARNYNISVTQLKRWNNLRRNLIRPGDELTIYLEGSDSNNN